MKDKKKEEGQKEGQKIYDKTDLKSPIPPLVWGERDWFDAHDFVIDLALIVSLQAHRAISGEPMHTF